MGGICTWMWMLVVLGEVQVVSYTDVKGAPQAAPPIPGALQPPLSLLAAASLEPLSPDSVRLIPRLLPQQISSMWNNCGRAAIDCASSAAGHGAKEFDLPLPAIGSLLVYCVYPST